MSKLTENDNQLVPFLRNLADSIETDKLSSEQLHCISDFFMSYKLLDTEDKKNLETDEGDFDSMDVVKFITLGWYIYKVLLKDQTTQDIPEDIPEDIP